MSNDDLYWQQHLTRQPFYIDGLTFDDYAPAFRMGHARQRDDTLFEDVQARLCPDWDDVKGDSRLTWHEARHAVRAAWERATTQAHTPAQEQRLAH
jgi:hypothetical protein